MEILLGSSKCLLFALIGQLNVFSGAKWHSLIFGQLSSNGACFVGQLSAHDHVNASASNGRPEWTLSTRIDTI